MNARENVAHAEGVSLGDGSRDLHLGRERQQLLVSGGERQRQSQRAEYGGL